MTTAVDMGRCRFCATRLRESFVDLGLSPLSNAYSAATDLLKSELFLSLHAFVCHECFLVQLQEFTAPSDMFTEYAYFSSFLDCWLEHCRAFAEDFTKRLRLGAGSRVVEIAGNDGYLLRFFKRAGIDVLGVEPARNVAAAAEKDGIPTIVEFFGTALADHMGAAGQRADLVIGNNVLAHVPDLNDFVEGLRLILRPGGMLSMEFPHLLRQSIRHDLPRAFLLFFVPHRRARVRAPRVTRVRRGRAVHSRWVAAGDRLPRRCGPCADVARGRAARPRDRPRVRSTRHVPRLRRNYLLILPWNLRSEIAEQMAQIREWGGKFVSAIPRVEIWP